MGYCLGPVPARSGPVGDVEDLWTAKQYCYMSGTLVTLLVTLLVLWSVSSSWGAIPIKG